MNRQTTQFWVAIIAMVGLVLVTGICVTATLFYDAPSELALMLVGGLIASTSAAGAWLFRLNGSGSGTSKP
jgi:hypothetical protein